MVQLTATLALTRRREELSEMALAARVREAESMARILGMVNKGIND